MNKVIVEKDGPVRTIWMNRPEKRNALDSELLREMIEVLRAPVAADDRVVVIRGKGPVFCAGLDMAERRETASAGSASGIEIMLRAIELCPLPVVAVVQGELLAVMAEESQDAGQPALPVAGGQLGESGCQPRRVGPE